MIPDREGVEKLWNQYNFPPLKRVHAECVTAVAMILAERIRKNTDRTHPHDINMDLLYASCMLHDIDKNMDKRIGDQHPDAAVRMLTQEGMPEVAAIVQSHPLHTILNDGTCPQSLEAKILYVADKMTKYTCIGVDKRFDLWRKEQLPGEAREIIEATYQKVIELRDELLAQANISENELILLSK